MHSRIVGTGSYLPAHVLTNHELAKTRRHERRVDPCAHRHSRAPDRRARRSRPAIWPSTRRARRSTRRASRRPTSISSWSRRRRRTWCSRPRPASCRPSSAPPGGPAFDVQAVCSGFVYALAVADRMVASAAWRATRSSSARRSIRASSTGTTAAPACCSATAPAPSCWCPRRSRASSRRTCTRTAAIADILCVPGSAQRTARSRGTPFVRMDGPAVFKFAVNVMAAGRRRSARRQRRRCQRGRLADSAPGQHPHHRRDREKARHAARARGHDRRAPRQHVGRLDPAGARRGGARRPHRASANACC